MKQILLTAALVCFGVSVLAADLSIEINPESPVFIPKGVNTGKTQPIGESFFAINSLRLKWKGSQNFQPIAISITSSYDPTFLCLGSDQMNLIPLMYSTAAVIDCNGNAIQPAVGAGGNVYMPPSTEACPVSIESHQFFCTGLESLVKTDPLASYNIPVTVTVVGVGTDPGGTKASRISVTKGFIVQ